MATVFASGPAFAEYTDGVIRIGVVVDMSSLYADISGPGAVTATRLAVQDFDAAAKGMKVEIVSADHQNRPDVALNIVSTWIDVDKVDVIVNGMTSNIGLAISELVRQKNKTYLATGPATSDLTGAKCSPNTIQWAFDTWSLSHGTAKAVTARGGDT